MPLAGTCGARALCVGSKSFTFSVSPRFPCSVAASNQMSCGPLCGGCVSSLRAVCLLVVCLFLSVSYIGICDCVSYLCLSSICFFVRCLLRSCVSGAEHGSTNFFAKLPGSFAGDAGYSEAVVRTWPTTQRRCTEQDVSYVPFLSPRIGDY